MLKDANDANKVHNSYTMQVMAVSIINYHLPAILYASV